jgi:catechol 2,3-dioxygenase-like lactoylglutathione lyase family enzyme
MQASLNRIIIYTRRMAEMVAFYGDHFGYEAVVDVTDRLVELRPGAGGAVILLHPAAKGQKHGQSMLKLVFDVADVPATRDRLIGADLDVGPIHAADGYEFANLKDPSGNSVSISSRAFRPDSR